MFFKNEDGAALVLVLLLLLVGTVLVGVLATTARNHINIAGHEEGMSKAFYNADSGVEFLKARMNNSDFDFSQIDENEYLSVDEDGNIKFIDSETWIDREDLKVEDNDIKFKIKADNSEDNLFVSEGSYIGNKGREYNQKIKFVVLYTLDSGTKNFNIQQKGTKEDADYYNINGQDNGISDAINIANWGADNFVDFSKNFLSSDFFNINDEFNLSKFGEEESYIYSNGDLKLSHTDIENSIVVVNGKLEMGAQTNVKNSLIIVKDYIDMNGSSSAKDWENPVFYIYGENYKSKGKEEYYLELNGTGDFDLGIDPNSLPDEIETEASITNWSQL
ncbi:MAG: hypothetical protein ACOC1O_06100 [bacterium]